MEEGEKVQSHISNLTVLLAALSASQTQKIQESRFANESKIVILTIPSAEISPVTERVKTLIQVLVKGCKTF